MNRSTGLSGVVLAGGQGRRMGSVDKGLIPLAGRPMVAHVLDRLRPQVDEIIVNANQNLDRYGAFGAPVVCDEVGGFAGPLAGIHAGVRAARFARVLTAPCDCPFLPLDLAERLQAALVAAGADLAVARTVDGAHPVFSLIERRVLPHLDAFLREGGRKVDRWYATLRVVEVAFDDCADAFRNINTREDLAAAGASSGSLP